MTHHLTLKFKATPCVTPSSIRRVVSLINRMRRGSITCDLSGIGKVGFIEMAVLIHILNYARKNKVELRIARPSSSVQNLMDIARVRPLFEYAAT